MTHMIKIGMAYLARAGKLAAGAALLALPMLIGSGATSANAEEMRIVTGTWDAHPQTWGLKRFAEYLKANTSLEPKVYLSELLGLPEIADGIREGIAAMGVVITTYKPVEYAETNLFADLSMLVTTGEQSNFPAAAYSGAIMEYVLLNCDDCQSQYKAMNQVFLGTASSTPYVLFCMKPVETFADLSGKKIRSAGDNFGRWVEAVGSTKVSIPGTEVFEALSQGTVDCSMLGLEHLVGSGLIDIVKYIHVGVPGGVFAGISFNTTNRDFWQGLSSEDRAVIIKGTATLVAETMGREFQMLNEGLEAANKKGIKVNNASEETMKHYAAFVESDIAAISSVFKDKYKLQNVDQKIATAQALITKWKGLTKGIETDTNALAELYWTEVLSKLDLNTYGMN